MPFLVATKGEWECIAVYVSSNCWFNNRKYPEYNTSPYELWLGSGIWTSTAPGADIWPGTRRKHTQGGQLDGSIRLLGIRSPGLLKQIALLNGCECLLKCLPVLVSLVGIRAGRVFFCDFFSMPLSLTCIKSQLLYCPSGALIFGINR